MLMNSEVRRRTAAPVGSVTSNMLDNDPGDGDGDIGGGGPTPPPPVVAPPIDNVIPTPRVVVGPPLVNSKPPVTPPPAPPPPPTTTPPAATPGTATSYVPPSGVARYDDVANTDPSLRTVHDNEVVQSRLGALLDGNSRYIQDARLRGREAAAKSGMLMSSVAAGMSERAAIESALPIASQDAATYTGEARDNQSATNQDRLTDQQNRTGFINQEIGIEANAAEAAQTRVFSADQAQRDRDFNASQAEVARTWQGTQADLARLQDRSMAYYNTMFGRESSLSQTIASIYSNTALTAAQQQAAVNNAMSVYGSLWATMNRTMSQGIPDIFGNPQPILIPAP